MAEEIPDGRFKSEVMTLLGKLISKADETTNSLENVRSDINSLSADVEVLSKQFNDVGLMSIKDHSRIDNVEARLSALEGEVH